MASSFTHLNPNPIFFFRFLWNLQAEILVMFIGFNAINRIFCTKFVYIKLRKLICLKNFCTTFSNIRNMLCTVCAHKIVPGDKCFPRIIIKKHFSLHSFAKFHSRLSKFAFLRHFGFFSHFFRKNLNNAVFDSFLWARNLGY